MVAAAVVGAAVVGGVSQSVAGSKAAKAQKKGLDASILEQQREYDQTRTDFAPWRTTGVSALGKLAGMYGVGTPATGTAAGATGSTPAAPYGGFEASPGYQWRLDQGEQAVQRSAASRGLLGSGAAVKAVQRYGEGLASSEYENYANRLASLAGVGQSATASTAAAGQNAANNISQADVGKGNATASSYLNTGAAISGALGSVAGAYGGGFKGFG